MKILFLCHIILWLVSLSLEARGKSYLQNEKRISNRIKHHLKESRSLECGIVREVERNHRKNRIYGGRKVKPGELPFLVELDVGCAGIIIDEWHILTGSFCVGACAPYLDEPYAYVGCHELTGTPNNRPNGNLRAGCTKVKIENIVIHEDERCEAVGGPGQNDIALLKTERPMRFVITKNGVGSVNSICLPDRNSKFVAGQSLYIAGWGELLPQKELVPNLAQLEVDDNDSCAEKWKRFRTVDGQKQICAFASGGRNISTCVGDTGGPLMTRRNGKYVLAGISSWGDPDCKNENYPDIFTRVTHFLDWIEKAKMKLSKLTIRRY